MPPTFTLTTFRGDTPHWPLLFTVSQAGAKTPLSLAGSTILFTVKHDPMAPDADALLHVAISPEAHTDADAGATALALSSSQTMLEQGSYHCDLKRLSDDGQVRTLAVGIFNVQQPVTHAVASGGQ